ncbi:MAG: hypothetical protein M3024_01215 [Candidatus Dormibacteraeota bacterium]|nr:hypothetical protein [Candidatus Dormibacteraeota bacterium]
MAFPELNLLDHGGEPLGGRRPRLPARVQSVLLVVFAVLIWAVVALGVAWVLGWHPHLPGGP